MRNLNNYVTGNLIKELREKKQMTQVELANKLLVSEKTISKWETGRGLPDISLIEPLSRASDVSIVELFNGEQIINQNKSANILKTKFYVCPVCGIIINTTGDPFVSCSGISLIPLEPTDGAAKIEIINDEYFVEIDSKMTKNDYISFIAYITIDEIEIKKLYPEQAARATFFRRGHGYIYYYDLKKGLFKVKK